MALLFAAAVLPLAVGQFASPYVVLGTGGTFDIQNSASQLNTASTVTTLVIPGDNVLDAPATSIITDRHKCTDYDMSFMVADPVNDPTTVTLTIQIQGAVSKNDKPKCTVYWNDGNMDEDVDVKDAPVDIDHTYANLGIYPVNMICEADVDRTSVCPSANSECVTTSNFMDDIHRNFATPMTFFTSESMLIKSYMEIASSSCGPPAINWRITKVIGDVFTPFTDFIQPNTSVLKIQPEGLEPGDYILSLEIIFASKSAIHWSEDLLVAKIVLPELVTHISGGELLYVPHGQNVFIDASISRETVVSLSSLTTVPLIATWSFAHLTNRPTGTFMSDFPTVLLPGGGINYLIQDGADYALSVDTSAFPVGEYGVAMFTLSRGVRQSSAMQVIAFMDNVLPLSIACVYNCHVGRERLFYYDKIELDTKLPSDTDITGFTYQWQIQVQQTFLGINWYAADAGAVTQTGLTGPSIGISSFLTQGGKYKITVSVESPGYATSVAEFIRTVNYVPYGGTCVTNSLNVVSGRDWLTVTCSRWLGNDDRKTIHSTADVNPILTYNVIQKTVGALVEQEPILQTRSQTSHLILKVGAPDQAYQTTLCIHITDMYKNYFVVEVPVTSNPAFTVDYVTPDEAGAAMVRTYTEVDYPFDEQQLRYMGKSDMIISLVSAVCSNLHLVDLPVWEPPVPRVLNTEGAILDLSSAGNTDIGTLDDATAAVDNETVDPATLAIQEVVMNMTTLIRGVVETDLVNGSRTGEKMLTSLITNAFTNLAAKSQFVNEPTKVDLIYLGDVVGAEALTIPNTTEDQSAQIETTSGEIYYMFQAIVNSAVPDDLNQIRPVGSLLSGRTQVDDMLSVIGQNISLNDSLISPVERAYFYMKMQRKLRLETDGKKKYTKEAARMAIRLAQDIQAKLKVCSTCSNEASTKTQQLVKKNDAATMERETIPSGSSTFRLDGLQTVLGNESKGDELVDVSAFEFSENVFMYDEDGTSSYVTSNILRIDIKATQRKVTPGFMTFEQNVDTSDPDTVKPDVDDEDASEFMYHKFIYQKDTDNVCMIILPMEEYNFTQYLVYIKLSGAPSIINYDVEVKVEESKHWQACVDPAQMKGHTGVAYLGVHLPGSMRTVTYNFTLVTVGCLTWEEQATKWHTDKCEFEWLPALNKISCFCEDVTDMVFSNSFFVSPNSIDFSTVFLRFSPLEQAAVLGTLAGICVIYIFAVILLIRLDRRDTLKWGITPLRDNIISDKHYYLIKVFTGMRRGAGTRSYIAFTLTGETGNTEPCEMFDGIRQEFSTGSIMSFFMATKRKLGKLQELTIWHDNSGEGDYASWYLNQVVVHDIEDRITYTFVAERWLSIDTNVDARINVTPTNKPMLFESRFFYQTRDRLSESHMWISILYRPQTSTFTRVQRASCALVYIFLTMIANAMYFNPDADYQSPPLVQVGPLRFTTKQIFISLVCALITTPVIMLLILLFKRTKHKQPTAGRSSCCKGCSTCCCCCSCGTFVRRLFRTRRGEEQRRYEEMLQSKMLTSVIPDFSGGFFFPSWFVYIAWMLVVAGTVVPAFFILLYSMEWGKQKSEEWLTTFFMSLLESMLFLDPIMVVCMAFVLALLIRTNKEDANVDMVAVVNNYRHIIGEDRATISSSIAVLRSITDDYKSYMTIPRTTNPPIHGDCLAQAANKHRSHAELMSTVKDTLLNFFFIFIISSICFANRDDRSFLHYTEVVNTVVSPARLPQFHSITTPGELYTWLNVSVIPSLFPEFDINGSPLHWSMKQFTTGYNDFRLGPPRLRQLRTKKGTCRLPYIGEVQCYGEYDMLEEEDDDYCIGWNAKPCNETEAVVNVSANAWSYTYMVDIWGLPLTGLYATYGGGGYIATLDVSRNISKDLINELFKNLWMDRQTRAVLFEFTLYNGATNIFIYNTFMVEFPETGGAFTSFTVYPIRVYTHQGPIGTFTLLCEIIFVIYLIVMLVKISIRIYQQRSGYFSKFWQGYEMVIFIACVGVIIAYAIRLGLTYHTINSFKKDRRLFVNFSHIVLWDQILVAFLGILVFMATLRVLEAFATSKKISAVVEVFQDCGKDLFWYGMTFLYIFLGFCILGTLLFGSLLLSYMNIYQCMGTLFVAMIGKSRFAEIDDAQPVLAKVFFIMYIMTVVFFILTMFLSILGASIDKVIHDTREHTKEDLLELIVKQIRSLVSKPSEKKNVTTETEESEMRVTSVRAIKINKKLSCTPTPLRAPTVGDMSAVPPRQHTI